MRLELFILGLTAFFIYNAYEDGKYTKMVLSYKKYYRMIFYAIAGIGLYYLLKRNPSKAKDLLLYANNYVKYLPIDKNSLDMLSPIIDFTETPDASFMESLNGIIPRSPEFGQGPVGGGVSVSHGGGSTKRSVSETKKKYVAANQDWKCGKCNEQLNHTFEIDHKLRLEYGGGNDVSNLVALCRNCHGLKTANENM